jgi:tripartite-type tricarboxylate transporter receptor subunit TctC
MPSLMRFAACLCLALASIGSFAQDRYPSKLVTIIVPYPPGGALDGFTRALAEGLRQEWKQQVIVDNKPGANEIIGASALAKAHPDGHTLMVSTEATAILNPLLFKKLPYDPEKQIAPVSMLVKAPLVFTVPASSPANTMKQFIEMAKARSGDPVRYGSAGAGGTGHLPFIAFAQDHQLVLIHVPYKGAGPLTQDLLGGHVEAGLLGTAVVEPHIKSGKLKGLAVSADKRLASLPSVPTYTELGIPDIDSTFIIALSAPAGTPRDVLDGIASTARKIMSTPEFQAKTLDPFGFVAVGSDPAGYAAYIKQQIPIQKKRVEAGGISFDL